MYICETTRVKTRSNARSNENKKHTIIAAHRPFDIQHFLRPLMLFLHVSQRGVLAVIRPIITSRHRAPPLRYREMGQQMPPHVRHGRGANALLGPLLPQTLHHVLAPVAPLARAAPPWD